MLNFFVRIFYQVVFERREWNASNAIVLKIFVGWCIQYVIQSKSFLFKMFSLQLLHTYFDLDS